MGNDEIAAKIYDMIVSKIKEHGYMIQASYNDDFQFAYTIGLHARYGFELVVAGLPMQIAGGVLQMIHRKMDKIEEFQKNVELVPGGMIRFYQCARTDDDLVTDVVVQADNYFGMKVPVVQVIVGTVNGEFFDDKDVDEGIKNQQPLLFAQPTTKTIH